MSNVFNPQIYSTQRRGTTTRLFAPKAGGSVNPPGMPHQNDVTVVGDKVFAKATVRKFFEFQNQDTVNDMKIAFGVPASADVGVLIGPLGSARWEIEVPSEEIHVFCAVASAKFSWQERQAQ
jgi:hypothetical protein